jgi:hypothetical protein
MKKFILYFVIFIIGLTGCGYKPSKYYTRAILKENIYTQIEINLRDPENAIFAKDALNSAVIQKFSANLTSVEKADTILNIALGGVSFSPIQYDNKGFVVAYNTYVSLNITRTLKATKERNAFTKSYSVRGTYDFPITANSIISDNKRFTAIKEASIKALNHFISKISFEGKQEKQ